MNVPLCTDCKHYRPLTMRVFFWTVPLNRPDLAKCAARTSPVDGSPKDWCSFERMDYHSCGPEGKLWEAK